MNAHIHTDRCNKPDATTVEIVVNGMPVLVPAGPIREVFAAAMTQANQIGALIDQWVLRTREGDVIPLDLPGGVEWALCGGQRFFLHLGLPPAADANKKLTPSEWAARIADRLESTAKDLERLHTVSNHRQANLIGFLKSEAMLLRENVVKAAGPR